MSIYNFRVSDLEGRFRLLPTSWALLKTFELYKQEQITREVLGRSIRLTAGNHESMFNVVVECGRVARENPEEASRALAIISAMSELKKIAEEEPPAGTFLKLPREVRHNIYHEYFKGRDIALLPHGIRHADCDCLDNPFQGNPRFKIDLSLALTCKLISDEALTAFYKRYRFYFPCCCSMKKHIEGNTLMKNVGSIKFHWAGDQSDVAIALLKDMNIRHLNVVLSARTTRTISKREGEIRRYFTPRARLANIIPQAMGFDELISLRGLKSVNVEIITRGIVPARPRPDVNPLLTMLADKVFQSKEKSDEEEPAAEEPVEEGD
ncbi:hypothetical protein F4677DRAFT_443565 [Hypoxylon crocopeplum]|nr:hypothetical protein F4677DRAFT_443565 [Hypoxylon crocopeplum]